MGFLFSRAEINLLIRCFLYTGMPAVSGSVATLWFRGDDRLTPLNVLVAFRDTTSSLSSSLSICSAWVNSAISSIASPNMIPSFCNLRDKKWMGSKISLMINAKMTTSGEAARLASPSHFAAVPDALSWLPFCNCITNAGYPVRNIFRARYRFGVHFVPPTRVGMCIIRSGKQSKAHLNAFLCLLERLYK